MWMGIRRPLSRKTWAFQDEPTTTASKCSSAALLTVSRNDIRHLRCKGVPMAAWWCSRVKKLLEPPSMSLHHYECGLRNEGREGGRCITRRADRQTGRQADSQEKRYRSCRAPMCDVSSKKMSAIFEEPTTRGLQKGSPHPVKLRTQHVSPSAWLKSLVQVADAYWCFHQHGIRIYHVRGHLASLPLGA